MKYKYLFLLLILNLAFLSCDEDENPECFDTTIDIQTDYDLYNTWELLGKVKERPYKKECADGVGGYISFHEDGTFGGSFSCNGMGGEYELSNGNELKILKCHQTLRGCVGNESAYWEETFSSELRKTRRFQINGNKLTLYTSINTRLIFKIID
ncbi:META domain-containing protein [Maribellus sediminis]|uniref:META domain-containing protein n=1 Tax=Maribellus sediminis TaxID=2696285 RepID=UPI001431510D|nr:META domain-containing protein [Maribellus sediminis]